MRSLIISSTAYMRWDGGQCFVRRKEELRYEEEKEMVQRK
jgi:hypothetical protein